jgi:hypothetical protein
LSEFRICLREYLRKVVADTVADKEEGIEDKTWAFKFTTYVLQIEMNLPTIICRERKLKYEQLRGLIRAVIKGKGGKDLRGFEAPPDLNSPDPFSIFKTPLKVPEIGLSAIKPSQASPVPKIGSFRYYTLYRGRDGVGKEVGGMIFTSWEGIRPYVDGVSGNIHKGFDLQYQAENFSMTGDANISQDLLMEFLASPEQKSNKIPSKKDPNTSLFNRKSHKLKTVIEEE